MPRNQRTLFGLQSDAHGEAENIFWASSDPSLIQVSLSTAHPAKFSEAVAEALSSFPAFDFDRDVLPEAFQGLLQMEQRVIDVESANVDLVKSVIDSKVGTGQM